MHVCFRLPRCCIHRFELAQVPDTASASGSEWAGEAYEPDSTRTADAAFLKFTRRLQRCPEQCVRYGCATSHLSRADLLRRPSLFGAMSLPHAKCVTAIADARHQHAHQAYR